MDRPEQDVAKRTFGLEAWGFPEHRFPLTMTSSTPSISRAWELAKRSHWDPVADVNWDELRPEQYSREELDAARLFWSRRVWSEYTGLAESPIVLLRLALDGWREPEAKFVLASKLMDEAKHVEASYILADRLGGYLAEPPESVDRTTLVAGLRDRALNPRLPVEAVLAAWHCVSETVAVATFRVRYQYTTNPVVRIVLARIIGDEARHISLGWDYLDANLPSASSELKEAVRSAMVDVIENVELGGFHSAAASGQSDLYAEIDGQVARSGLGAAPGWAERKSLADSLTDIRERARRWGVELPTYQIDGQVDEEGT